MMASLTSLTSVLPEFLGSNTSLLLLSSTLVILFYLWINSGPTYEEIFAKRNVEHFPLPNFLLDMVRKVRLELQRDEVLKKTNGLFGSVLLGKPTIFIQNPDLVQQVMVKHFTSFTNRRVLKMVDPVFSNALFMVEGEKWKRCRSIMTPTFAMGKLRLMKPILDDTAHTMIDNIGNAIKEANGEPIELKHICGAFTMDAIVQISFGVKIDSLVDRENPLLKHAKTIFQTDFKLYNVWVIAMTFLCRPLAKVLKLRMNPEAQDYFESLTKDIIKNKRELLQNNNNNNNGLEYSKAANFIELLLEAEAEWQKLEKGSEESNGTAAQKPTKAIKYMTNEEIVAQCILFLMVGYDTTATTITLTLYNLALNPETQERLYEEIISTMKDLQAENEEETDPVKLFTMERIQKMKYLECVVKETLRLYPPATFTERSASEDVTLENGDNPIYVKEGDVINIPMYTMHRDPAYWNEPETYNPERFMDPNPTFHKMSYIPFGAGPRDCIAKSLAYLEAKVAILHAVRCFRYIKCAKTPVPIQFYFQSNLLINKDVHVNVERRS